MSVVETEGGRARGSDRALAIAGGIGRFLLIAVSTYLGLLAVTFFIGRVIPIDPVLAVLGDRAPESVVERTRREMGLDLPLIEQFWIYLKAAVNGDFGTSVLTTNPVMADIRRVFPATIELASVGTLIGTILGIPLGVLAAVKRGSLVDQLVRVVGLIGYSVPIFWLALLALVLFYAKLQWVAFPGRIDIVYQYTFTPITGFYLIDAALQGQWDVFWDVFRHIILPGALLGYFSLAYISRMTRSFMLNELSQEYIVAARAKGLSETRIIWGHALRNAAVPMVTVIALSYAGLLEGSVLTETVFSWPGIGLYITDSLQNA
ncbi:MAG: ABC transporter permease, partial [Mesorhizobium sp.]|nr:ABC transporter permease [Mesorhizobium sp.]